MLDVRSLSPFRPDTENSVLIIRRRKAFNNIWTQERFDGIKQKTIKCIWFYVFSLRLPIIFVFFANQYLDESNENMLHNLWDTFIDTCCPIALLWLLKLLSNSHIRQPSMHTSELMKNPIFIAASKYFSPFPSNFHASM